MRSISSKRRKIRERLLAEVMIPFRMREKRPPVARVIEDLSPELVHKLPPKSVRLHD